MDHPQSLEIGAAEVVLQNVVLPMGLVLNALTLHALDLHLETDPFRASLPAPGKMEALLLGDNLADFLNQKSPGGLRDFKVELRDGKIFVTASVMIMKASAVCTLRIENRNALYVDLESVDVLGVGARNLVQNQLEKINPVLNTSDLPIPATLDSYDISEGRLVVRGTVSPPNS